MSNSDKDYLLALELQKEFQNEMILVDDEIQEVPSTQISRNAVQKKRARPPDGDEDLNLTQNLVHPQWETLDPTPDVQSLFVAFDGKFFQRRLQCVTLEWSKRMYSCAGICYSRRNRMGMSITIRLSEPLLKLRSRKDLVETLIHEMIHAYCFVLGIREGNGGHGPNFKKIMNGINQVAGTNITVYHTFHDEVDLYKTHWWRCNGICQHRKPFFGYVKRTSNRAPGPNDMWWTQHLNSCGGTFLKVKEPEKKQKEKAPKKAKSDVGVAKPTKMKAPPPPPPAQVKDLRNFFPTQKGPIKSNGGGTLLLNPRTKPTTTVKSTPVASSTPTKPTKLPPVPGGNLRNVIGFKDLDDTSPSNNTKPKTAPPSMSGQGYSLSGSSSSSRTNNTDTVDRDKLRNIWANRFSTPATSVGSDIKRRRLSTEQGSSSFVANEAKDDWTSVGDDDEVLFKEVKHEIIALSSSDDEDYDNHPTNNRWTTQVTTNPDDRQKLIKQEILNDDDMNDSDIELIDDEYDDDAINTSVELADTSLVDDLFGEDTLLKDFNNSSSKKPRPSTSRGSNYVDEINCPICQERLSRDLLSDHLDGCTGITKKILPKKIPGSVMISDGSQSKTRIKASDAELLRKAGYTETDLKGIIESEDETDSFSENQPCPVCAKSVPVGEINEHLDICLGL